MKQDAEGVVCQRGFVEQLLEVPLSLLFRRPTEPAGVVINDHALPSRNQLANLAPESVLAGFTLSGPQIGALHAIVGIEKHDVALGGRLECTLEPNVAGTGDLPFPLANVLTPVDRTGEQVLRLQSLNCPPLFHDTGERRKERLITFHIESGFLRSEEHT